MNAKPCLRGDFRDLSELRVPPNVRLSETEFVECPHCHRKSPRPYAVFAGKSVAFPPIPCDCEAAMAAASEPKPPIRKRVPKRYAEAAASIDAEAYLAIIRSGKGLWIYGKNGTGKTATAEAIAAGADVRCEVVSAQELAVRCTDFKTREESFAEYGTVPLLVIDDLGKESPSKDALAAVFRVVDERYRREKPLVVTSNFAIQGIMARYATVDNSTACAVASRVSEMCRPVSMDGRDRRLG